jgi:hypothetical protein
MPAKKTSKRAAPKQSVSSHAPGKKNLGKKSGKKRSSPGLISRATKVVRAVVGAATDVATGVVRGAVEAGSRVTGIGPERGKGGRTPKGTGKSKSQRRANESQPQTRVQG